MWGGRQDLIKVLGVARGLNLLDLATFPRLHQVALRTALSAQASLQENLPHGDKGSVSHPQKVPLNAPGAPLLRGQWACRSNSHSPEETQPLSLKAPHGPPHPPQENCRHVLPVLFCDRARFDLLWPRNLTNLRKN